MTAAAEDRTAERMSHLKEIRSLLRQLTNDASPSGAQTISSQIGDHLNELENDLNGRKTEDGRSIA